MHCWLLCNCRRHHRRFNVFNSICDSNMIFRCIRNDFELWQNTKLKFHRKCQNKFTHFFNLWIYYPFQFKCHLMLMFSDSVYCLPWPYARAIVYFETGKKKYHLVKQANCVHTIHLATIIHIHFVARAEATEAAPTAPTNFIKNK